VGGAGGFHGDDVIGCAVGVMRWEKIKS